MIIEILDRRGQVVTHHKVTAFPVRIGRAYDNSVILSDPRADAHHAEIHRIGDAWRFDDCSAAGRRSGDDAGRRSDRIESGSEVRIGRTRLRFLSEDHPVPATQRDRPLADAVGSTLRSPTRCLLIVLAGILVAGAVDFFGSYQADQLEESASVSLFALLLVALWAGPWAFANRSFTHEGRFLAHSAIACAFFTVGAAIDTAAGTLSFVLLPSSGVSELLSFAIDALFVGALLLAHLSLLSHAPLRRRLASVALVTLVTLSILEFGDWTEGDFLSSAIEFPAELKALDPSWLSTESPERFFTGLDELEERVEELAAEDEDTDAAEESDSDAV